MSKRSVQLPSAAEFRILEVLWAQGPQTVRQVHEELGRTRDLQYTTALRMLQNMHAKRLVTRDASARSHIYQAAVDRDWATNGLVTDLTKRAFRGSTASLAIRALSLQPATNEELAEIRALLARMPRKR